MKKLYVSDLTLARMDFTKKKMLTFRERVQIARRLDTLGFDAIELPAVSNEKEDFVVCRTIAAAMQNSQVALPVRTAEELDTAWKCLADAKRPCIQVKLPVSTVQMEYLAHTKSDGMLARIAELCRKAHETGAAVEFVACDASRADAAFLHNACRVAQENGADAVTLCDDAGILMPEELAEMVTALRGEIRVRINVQPSDAVGMAVACAIAALRAGADGVKTAMEGSDVMSAIPFSAVLRSRGEQLGFQSDLKLTELSHGLHELWSGIRLEAEAKDPSSEPSNSEGTLGTLSAASTREQVSAAVVQLGYDLSAVDVGRVFVEVRRVVEKKRLVGAKDLDAIIASTAMQAPSTYHLESYVSTSGNIMPAMAQVTLVHGGERTDGVSTGDGPIDAAFRAIEQVIGHHYELDEFRIQAVTEGREALGSAVVRLRSEGKLYAGNGISTDIIGASIRAYINALNKIVYAEG